MAAADATMQTPHFSRRRAFSLAELLIALLILGIGLLFIAAALPAGLRYTKETIDRTNAEVAAEEALSTVEQYVRTTTNIPTLAGVSPAAPRIDSLVRPRNVTVVGPNTFRPLAKNYEPLFVVRPLVGTNIRDLGGQASVNNTHREVPDTGEALVRAYLATNFPALLATEGFHEADLFGTTDLTQLGPPNNPLSIISNPVLPAVARVFPAIDPFEPYRAIDYLNNPNGTSGPYPRYQPRNDVANTIGFGATMVEMQKAAERRVAWTAFYRRVSYERDGAENSDSILEPADPIVSDPLLYELIVVVCQRPSPRHFFAQQLLPNLSPGVTAFRNPVPVVGSSQTARLLVPQPWLIQFDETRNESEIFNGLPRWPATVAIPPGAANQWPLIPRQFNVPIEDLPRTPLRFGITTEVDPLLPVGSIMIPAFNAWRSDLADVAGFIPALPESLPILKVVERPDRNTVVVENFGHWPYTGNVYNPARWPVWIIPPAVQFESGQALFDDQPSVLAVARRIIRVPEVVR